VSVSLIVVYVKVQNRWRRYSRIVIAPNNPRFSLEFLDQAQLCPFSLGLFLTQVRLPHPEASQSGVREAAILLFSVVIDLSRLQT
jgi:hypothetical protein